MTFTLPTHAHGDVVHSHDKGHAAHMHPAEDDSPKLTFSEGGTYEEPHFIVTMKPRQETVVCSHVTFQANFLLYRPAKGFPVIPSASSLIYDGAATLVAELNLVHSIEEIV